MGNNYVEDLFCKLKENKERLSEILFEGERQVNLPAEECVLPYVIREFYKEFTCSEVPEDQEGSNKIGKLWELIGINNDNSIPIRFGVQEKAIESILNAFKENKNEGEVLAKVVLINQLYSTGLNGTASSKIISVGDMAKHIVNMAEYRELDEKIKEGKPVAVDLIGNLKENGYNNAFSFASKYCNWHSRIAYKKEDAFPIMDNYTKDFIYYWCKHKKRKITKSDLEDYRIYAELLQNFKKDCCGNCSLKEIDAFLWIYAKAKEKEK